MFRKINIIHHASPSWFKKYIYPVNHDVLNIFIQANHDALNIFIPANHDALNIVIPGINDARNKFIPANHDAINIIIPGINDAWNIFILANHDALNIFIPANHDTVNLFTTANHNVNIFIPANYDALKYIMQRQSWKCKYNHPKWCRWKVGGKVLTMNYHTKRACEFFSKTNPVTIILARFSLVFRFTSASVFLPHRAGFSLCTCSCTVGKKEVSFSMTIGNEELMHECFRMGTARMK